jgi:hypothetical protein
VPSAVPAPPLAERRWPPPGARSTAAWQPALSVSSGGKKGGRAQGPLWSQDARAAWAQRDRRAVARRTRRLWLGPSRRASPQPRRPTGRGGCHAAAARAARGHGAAPSAHWRPRSRRGPLCHGQPEFLAWPVPLREHPGAPADHSGSGAVVRCPSLSRAAGTGAKRRLADLRVTRGGAGSGLCCDAAAALYRSPARPRAEARWAAAAAGSGDPATAAPTPPSLPP